MTTFAALADLAAKGNGTLVRHDPGHWSYPGAPSDPAASNLHLPMESVSQSEVDAALADGAWSVVMRSPAGLPIIVASTASPLGQRAEITAADFGTASLATIS